MVAERWVRTCLGSVPESAERARRFCVTCQQDYWGGSLPWKERVRWVLMEDTFGSCKSSFSQVSVVLIDRVGSHAVEGKSLAESGVRGVSISFLT